MVHIDISPLKGAERWLNGVAVVPLLAIAAAENDPALMALVIDARISVAPGWDARAFVDSLADAVASFVEAQARRRSVPGFAEGRRRRPARRPDPVAPPAAAPPLEAPAAVDSARFWEGVAAEGLPPRGMRDEPGKEPPWGFQAAGAFPPPPR